MKPRTSGFCARAAPPRPRAAAPATLPSRPRRPMVNLSIMLLPPRWCRPEAAWEDGQQAVCQHGFEGLKGPVCRVFTQVEARLAPSRTDADRRIIVCNFSELHSI